MQQKVCLKCGRSLSIEDYYIGGRNRDLRFNKCKDCIKEGVRANYFANKEIPGYIEKERKRGRDKYYALYRFTGTAKPENNKRWLEKYPEKREAHSASHYLKKPFENAEKHHWSYNEEHYKDVIFLTKQEHMKAHRFIHYDQEAKKYRRYDNFQLLETKQAHEDWILHCIKTEEN